MDKVSFTSDLALGALKKNHNAIKALIGDEYKEWKPLDVITISAQTGSGKTSFILETLLKWVIELAQNKNIYHPIYCFVNRKILKEQLESTLVNEIQVQYDQCPRRVVVNNFIKIFTYQEVQEQIKINNLHLPCPQHIDPIDNQPTLKEFAFVIYDECHYFLSDSTFNPETFLAFSDLINYYDKEIQIYMSATIDDIRVWLDACYKKSNMTVSNVMGVRNTSTPYIPVPFVSALRTTITDWNIHDYIGKSDYSFINLHAINDEDELPYLVKDKAATGKWLIFVNSKAYGDALYKELNKDDLEGDVVFLDAEYTDSEETTKAVDEITTRKASSKRVVICTSVLDNGVSFFDTELNNIVVLTDMQEEFLQMFGRKRFDGNPVDIYICKRDKSFFSRRKRSVERTRDVINRYRFSIEMWNLPIQRQYLFNSILKSDYIYHQLRKFCYSRFGVLRVSPFSISRLAKMQEFYSEMEIAMDSSDDAFLAKQASWLGKSLDDIDQLSIKESPEWKHERIDVVLKEVAGVAEITMDKKQNFEPLVERPVRVLETTVAVEQGMRIWVGRCRLVKSPEHQRIVVSFAYHIGDDTPVIQVQNGAEIQLVYLHTFIPLEFCHICEPFLVGLVRVELAVQQVFGYVLRIAGMPGAAVPGILDCGPDILCPADTEHSLVVDVDVVIVFQVIPDAPVSLIRGLVVDVLNDPRKLLILSCPPAYLAGGPFVVGRP